MFPGHIAQGSERARYLYWMISLGPSQNRTKYYRSWFQSPHSHEEIPEASDTGDHVKVQEGS